MDKVKIGVIGTGSISNLHMAGYNRLENVEVIAACDINEERVRKFAETYHIANTFTDYNEMLKMEELDAVSVTAWNNVHAPASIAALNAGKHVLCEKPLALNADEALGMVETSKKNGKILMVGFCRRFGENAVSLKEMIAKGDLGQIYYAKTGCLRRCGNPGGWFSDRSKSGGGPVIDLGVHMIDLVRYLSGKPRAVSVMASTFDHMGMRTEVKGITKYNSADYSEYNDVEDCATALIRFENGMTLFFETSWVQNIKEDSLYLELFGDKAGVTMEPEFEIYESKYNYLRNTKPVLNAEGSGFEHNFIEEIKHFINCIADGAICLNPAEDGLELMRIIDAIYQSAKTGHEVLI
ncbi:Gfo/Idh/MocA family protein [Anaerocolumna xylanovorans]|uniref:Predicted dehydrogenase n=1 Tax=Anaerocolumna xylanovorans DSM 12503 TaxID=1121345 RepID=A0A1M7XWM6_9FIRM|nr:Gfo/Idh/MocA family oxidoreductase [Anaerocolumna xylanovorans]SHO43059.1 Predicted dehydrogenase [Anaerocolumna xylanovorans DSM 12503]